ncbi:MAG: hypothetical protein WA254_11735 [Candidatus Sulfotelmatobacter sp.]
MFAVESKALQAAVAAVGYDEEWRVITLFIPFCFKPARIDPQAVRAIELIVGFAQSAEGANEFGFLAVLIDEAGAVSVTYVDVAVWGYGYVGWPVGYG